MHAWFLEIVSSTNVGVLVCVLVCWCVDVCVCACVRACVRGCVCEILAIDKLNGRGLDNTVRHEHLPKKTKVTRY